MVKQEREGKGGVSSKHLNEGFVPKAPGHSGKTAQRYRTASDSERNKDCNFSKPKPNSTAGGSCAIIRPAIARGSVTIKSLPSVLWTSYGLFWDKALSEYSASDLYEQISPSL